MGTDQQSAKFGFFPDCKSSSAKFPPNILPILAQYIFLLLLLVLSPRVTLTRTGLIYIGSRHTRKHKYLS